jgi:hypothetical protein
MSDDNVVELKLLTTINLPPERILNAALEADLAALVIVGYDKNGEYYFHSSIRTAQRSTGFWTNARSGLLTSLATCAASPEPRSKPMTDKLLREAAQNILNGIETGAIKIETDQDESWANALSALRSALAQSESEPDKLEKPARAIYDMMNPDCLDGYLQEFSAEGLRVKGNPCPTCHGEKP